MRNARSTKKRRTILAVAGTTAIANAGCLEAVRGTGDDSSPADSGTDGSLNESGDDTSPDESDDEGDHHLYVENLTDEPLTITLEVVRRRDDAAIVDGTYKLRAERGGELEAVAAWGETYDVTATVEGSDSRTFTWSIDSCDGSEAPNGSRNGSVRVRDEGSERLSFVVDDCDELVAGTDVPTGPACQFEVEDDATGDDD